MLAAVVSAAEVVTTSGVAVVALAAAVVVVVAFATGAVLADEVMDVVVRPVVVSSEDEVEVEVEVDMEAELNGTVEGVTSAEVAATPQRQPCVMENSGWLPSGHCETQSPSRR